MAVSDVHKNYSKYVDKWQRSRDVCEGQDAVHRGGTRYLPMLRDQDFNEYSGYVRRASFYNASWRTVAGFIGMLFKKSPTLNVPDALNDLLDDVTLTGVDFDTFAQSVALEAVSVSRVGVLVDHPPELIPADGEVITVADAQNANQRPVMKIYNTESIINWRKGYVNNAFVTTQIRLKETTATSKSEFEEEYEEIIRVLDLDENGQYRQRLYDKGGELQSTVNPKMNGAPMTFIPFYSIGPDGIEIEPSDPILIDLFNVNLNHYKVSADYEHACHMTALPTAYITGYVQDPTKPEEKFYIGSTAIWLIANENSKVNFLEYQGGGLSGLEANLAQKEAQMAAIGARMLAPEKNGVEAADTLTMRHNGENSILGAVAGALSTGLTAALTTFAQWANITGDCEYEINKDFVSFTLDGPTLTALLAIVQAGKMSPLTFFELLQRGNFIDEEKTWEDEQAEIDANPPPPPTPFGATGFPTIDPITKKVIPPVIKVPPVNANAA